MSGLQNRKIAVTGSTGMIGSHLVAELVRAGYDDIILPVRNAAKITAIRRTFDYVGLEMPGSDKLHLIETQLTDTDRLAEIFEGVDTVFHCAAVIMTGELNEQQLIDNNIDVARSVADASIKAGVKRIIHTSSVIVYSPRGFGNQVDESSEPYADSSSSAYGQSKYYSYLEMLRARDAGIELITLAPSVVIGEGDWSLNGSSAMIALISGGLPVYANGVMSYVDVRDVARAYIAVDNCPQAVGKSFIVSGADLTYRELISLGADASGRRRPFIKVGKGLVYSAYGIIKALTFLRIMKNRSITKENLGTVLYGNRYDGTLIERVCGFRYTPIDETTRRVVTNYLKDTGKKKGKKVRTGTK